MVYPQAVFHADEVSVRVCLLAFGFGYNGRKEVVAESKIRGMAALLIGGMGPLES